MFNKFLPKVVPVIMGRKPKYFSTTAIVTESDTTLRHTYVAYLVYYVPAVLPCGCSVIGRRCESTQYRGMCPWAAAGR